jgi:hypothetical protein
MRPSATLAHFELAANDFYLWASGIPQYIDINLTLLFEGANKRFLLCQLGYDNFKSE